jgi:putative heme-binding domain-containing protein
MTVIVAGCLISDLIIAAESGIESSEAHAPLIAVADGFAIDKIAGAPLVDFPMMAAFDEQGRLFVAASVGVNLSAPELYDQLPHVIRMLEDTDGDGTFDRATTFADNMTFPQGALWHEGALYVASPPSIWKLEDTDGDGRADKRTEIATGFVSTGNGASIHGPFFGPTGRIYWCHGRKGHEVYQRDGTLVSKAKGARVWSSLPDGSDIRVFAGGGMDNPVELVFTAEGELFGTVDLFHAGPRRDVLVHWTHGGVYPRGDQLLVLAEFKQTGDVLSHMVDLGHVAPSGLVRYRSTHFGPEFQNNLFLCEFNTHRVMRAILEPTGSTYQGRAEVFLSSTDSGVHFTDVLEDADGSLLVIDTGGWFLRGCPTSSVARPEVKGAIYRIRKVDRPYPDDPRGLKLPWDDATATELIERFDDPRPAVRDRAVDTLAARQKVIDAELLSALDHPSRRARIRAVWAAARTSSARAVEKALSDFDPSVQQAATHAVRALSEVNTASQTQLMSLLGSDKPAIRRETATTLGILGNRQAVPELLAALGREDNDRLAEHAMIYALIEIDDPEATQKGLDHDNTQVQHGALIALDQMDHGRLCVDQVVPLLDRSDSQLQNAAMKVVTSRPDWGKQIVGRIQKWLDDEEVPESRTTMLHAALLAFHQNDDLQQSVADALVRRETSLQVRTLLLDVISRIRADQFPQTWSVGLRASLQHTSAAVQQRAVFAITSLELSVFDNELQQLALDSAQSDELRLSALSARIRRHPKLDMPSFMFLLSLMDEDQLPLVRRSAAQALGLSKPDERQSLRLVAAVSVAGPLELPALLPAFENPSDEVLGRALAKSLAESPGLSALSASDLRKLFEKYPSGVRSDAKPLIEAIERATAEQSQRLLETLATLPAGDVEQGRQLFFSKKATCSACHTVGEQGGTIGPNLTTIGASRSRRDLLEAIMLPNATIARNFEPYVVLTDDGRVISGVVSSETIDSIYLVTADRAQLRVPRDSIEELRLSDVSIMPTGLDRTFSKDELGDILAFLQSLAE